MNRITWHWSAGTHKVSKLDRRHYHFAIDGNGVIHKGDHRPEDNLDTSTPYAAHTRGANTGNIGIALCAMHGAKESPFDPGKYPITNKQVDALVKLTAELCDTYRISVTPRTVLSHAEWQPTNGVKQRGKWDISWLPGMNGPGNPVTVGTGLRKRVLAEMQGKIPGMPNVQPIRRKGFWANLVLLIRGIVAALTGIGRK
ncbi:MAG: peptidoglycan recognition protein family protein [Pikeienuella sp.]